MNELAKSVTGDLPGTGYGAGGPGKIQLDLIAIRPKSFKPRTTNSDHDLGSLLDNVQVDAVNPCVFLACVSSDHERPFFSA